VEYTILVIWYIWKHRNSIIFDNRVCDVGEVFNKIQVKSWAVVKGKYNNVYFPYPA